MAGDGLTFSSGASLSTGAVLPFLDFAVNQYRLSTKTGTPVTTADQAAQSTLYLTPATGQRIGLYTTALGWQVYSLAETSLALSGLTTNTIYDVFAFLNNGVLALELSAAWSGNTPSDVISNLNGVPVKQSNNTRRWVGTIRASAATTVEDTAIKRWVWNAYNQVTRRLQKGVTVDNHTYGTSSWREWNNGTNGPHRYSFVSAVQQSFAVSGYAEMGPGNVGAGNITYASLSLNTVAEGIAAASCGAAVLTRCNLTGVYDSIIGFNEMIVCELSAAASSTYNQYVVGAAIQG